MLDFANARGALLPRHPSNPVGQTRRIAKARRAAFKDIDRAQALTIAAVESWPVERVNRYGNAFYDFKVSLDALRALVAEIERTLAGGEGPTVASEAAQAAYREGIAKAAQNLAGLSDDYTRTVFQRLGDALVQRRAALAGARVFEQMEGFAGETAADLSRILFDAVQTGENPRDTAKAIRQRFSVSKSRAERIARTEVTGALRRGRWDEARDAEEKLGMQVRLIHYSALIAGRTRRSHARRHGKIVTVEEQAAWYSQDANSINCLCTATEVTVDADGKPIFGKKLLDRLEKQREAFMKSAPDAGEL